MAQDSSDSKKPLTSEATTPLPISPTFSDTINKNTQQQNFSTPPTFQQSQNECTSPQSGIVLVNLPNDSDIEEAIASSLKDVGMEEAEPLLQAPPPDFSEYIADFSTSPTGDIISHDKHLNEDGEALYRFLLSHASTKPKLLLKCKGSHTEWRTRQITRYEDGKNVTSTETYSEDITDFDFIIDASPPILPPTPAGAYIWLVGDRDAAYRGGSQLQVDSAPTMVTNVGGQQLTLDLEAGARGGKKDWRRDATKNEKDAAAAWRQRREDCGYGPWVLMRGQIRGTEASVESPDHRHELEYATNGPTGGMFDDSIISSPTKSLRDWADEYCASHKRLKQFTFTKVVLGWNITSLKQAVENTIRANYVHQSQPVVSFTLESSSIFIRPDKWYSRALSKTWVLVILWITLIYPLFIWPFKRFTRNGSGEWSVAGSAFPLTKWMHLRGSIAGETVEEYRQRTASPKLIDAPAKEDDKRVLKATPKGVSELVGEREGEWFAKWEDTIASLVRQRHVSYAPVTRPLGSSGTAGIGLDGYYRG